MNKQITNNVGAGPVSAQQKGITLIALVITIIVLLILAGVTISMVLGDDGIIKNAQGASSKHAYKTAEEDMKRANLEVSTKIKTNKIEDGNYDATEDMENLVDLVEGTLAGEKWTVAKSGNVITMTYEDGAIKKAEEGNPTQEGWVSGTITVLNTGTEFAFDEEGMKNAGEIGKPTLSEDGVYYEQPYVGTTADGYNAMLILYEDGRAEALINLAPYATDTATYNGNTITFATFGPATISEEGKQIYVAALDLIVTLQEIEEKPAVASREMTDSKGNEWVWIEVPKSIYSGVTIANEENITDSEYEAIEDAMEAYATDYRNGSYVDEYYEGCGFESKEAYDEHKKSMLASVYTNGGFWVGKYEAGTNVARYSSGNTLVEAKINQDMYPYNYVTQSQAQDLASSLSVDGKTASLMFGVQWDLMLKYIESKEDYREFTTPMGAEIRVGIREALKYGSQPIGNYNDVEFKLSRGEYSIEPWNQNSWKGFSVAESGYVEDRVKQKNRSVLLTTGATARNSVLGIYDFAGNVYEWTLEQYESFPDSPCACRGGYCGSNGSRSAACRNDNSTGGSNSNFGFRPAMW